MTIALRTDAFKEFKYDPKSSRYRVVESSGRGRYISRQAFHARLDNYIQSQQQKLVGLADSLTGGNIDLPSFQRTAARLISDIHASASLRQVESLSNAEQQILLRRVKEQLYAGKDWQSGKPYGIRSLANQIRQGEVSPAQLRARLSAYAKAARLTESEIAVSIAKRQGKTYGVRRLGSGVHCAECPGLQQLTPVPIEKITPIGSSCSCGVNCLCTIIPMDLETAISQGLEDPRPAQKRKRELERIQAKGFGQRRRRDARDKTEVVESSF